MPRCWSRSRSRWCKPKPLRNRSEEHTSELQSLRHLVCRLLLEKKKKKTKQTQDTRYPRRITTLNHATGCHTVSLDSVCLLYDLSVIFFVFCFFFFFFLNNPAPPEFSPFPLPAPLPIFPPPPMQEARRTPNGNAIETFSDGSA